MFGLAVWTNRFSQFHRHIKKTYSYVDGMLVLFFFTNIWNKQDPDKERSSYRNIDISVLGE